MDGGGGLLKVIVNVFDVDEDTESRYMNSGVQRCQILAIVEDVPESNYNLRMILEKLNLQDVKFSAAFDLKCANAVFGLSSHAGKRACLWCDGVAGFECGNLRTLGSLDYWYERYSTENNCKKSNMKDFMNVIKPRLLYTEDDPNTLLQTLVPPPELHLMIGVVSSLGNLLMDLWPGFDTWLKLQGVLQRGYQGRGWVWDGNNSNKILKNLGKLEIIVTSEAPQLLQIVKCFKDFRAVKEACFGKNLEKGFHRSFEQLKNSFISVQEMAEGLGGKLSITWKIHILLCHVLPFVEYNNCGLSKYAEQCGEAIHSKFKPTHSRYKRMEEHPEHGERLLSSVLSFNGRRIC